MVGAAPTSRERAPERARSSEDLRVRALVFEADTHCKLGSCACNSWHFRTDMTAVVPYVLLACDVGGPPFPPLL